MQTFTETDSFNRVWTILRSLEVNPTASVTDDDYKHVKTEEEEDE